MLEAGIVILIVLAAAAYLVRIFVRWVRTKSSCGSCVSSTSSSKPKTQPLTVGGRRVR